jgi:photosystem II stability/assembly factor-like uncharacterized protein
MRRSPTILLSILCSLFFGKLGAQDWVEGMQDPSTPFDTVQKEFRRYWQGREKGPGWKQFKRWENFLGIRSYPRRNRIPGAARWKAWQDLLQGRSSGSSAGDWDYIGNQDIPMNGGAGRINCIAYHPKDANTVFAGSASGGLWKSTNDGKDWTPMTDHQPVLGVSEVLIHPSDPDTIYIATGDGDGSDTYSIGVLRTYDGGDTWSRVGWKLNPSDQVLIHDLIMNRKDPSILLASTDKGLYRTENGGDDWDQVRIGRYGDLTYHPTDTSIVYAIDRGDTRFERSTDGGNSFQTVTNGVPDPSLAGRMEIAVSKDDPSRVYFVAGDASNGGFYGLYRSNDAGRNFTLKTDTPNLLGYRADGSGTGGQAWYDLAITAHPKNADHVYVGGINVWRSSDGGNSFDIRTHWWGDQNLADVHADQHHLSFDRYGRLWAGNDGGVFRSPDAGDQWEDLSDGLRIAQIYRIGQSEQDPSLIMSGWQDNGTNRRSGTGNWHRVIGGDGMECLISHSDPSTMYGTIYFGKVYRSRDGGASFSGIVRSDSSNSVHERGGWVTPYMMNPQNSDEIIIGKKDLYRSFDGGDNWTRLNSVNMGSGNFRTLARCELSPEHIYVAKRGELWKKDGSGTSFSRRDSDLPLGQVGITHVAAHSSEADKAWVTLSGYDAQEKVYYTEDGGDSWTNRSQGLPNVPANCVVHQKNSPERVYVGTDLGVYYRDSSMSRFEPFNEGLPNVIVNELAVHEGARKLRAATYGRGLWESELRGDEPSSLISREKDGELELHPNPTDGRLKGRMDAEAGSLQLIVRDAAGRAIREVSPDLRNGSFHLDLSDLEQGLYFLEFEGKGVEGTKKLIVR